MIRHGAIADRLLLPAQRSRLGVAAQGWRIATTVGKSRIPGAGDGRFSDEAVRAGSVVSVKPIVPVGSLSSLRDVPSDSTLTFASRDDLEAYVSLCVAEGGYEREQVLEQFENFLWSLDGTRGFLNQCTWTMNHADAGGGLNVRFAERPGRVGEGAPAIVGEALCDIRAGDELRNDYREFEMPGFYTRFCGEHGFKDVRTAVLLEVDGFVCETRAL